MLDRVREQLVARKLHGMAEAPEAQLCTLFAAEMDFAERLQLLVEQEKSFREDRKLTTLLRKARLRYPWAGIEELQMSPKRGLSKATIMDFARNEWIKNRRNHIITGATGAGKTWLACTFGVAACRAGMTPITCS